MPHPAVYSNEFIEIFFKYLKDTKNVFDPLK